MPSGLAISAASERRRARTARQLAIGLAFLSPWLIGFLSLTLYPMLASAYYSLTEFNIVTASRWVGLGNYVSALRDPEVRLAIGNTLYMVVVGIPIQQVSAFLFASLLNIRVRGQNVFRTVYFLPYLMPPVAAGLMWTYMLNPKYGLVNSILRLVGVRGPAWLLNPLWAKPALILIWVWSLGSATLIYLAALQDVPKELYESAQIDGAGRWARMRNITIPMVSAVTLFNVVMAIISAFQIFTTPYILAQTSSGGGAGAAVQGAPQGSLLFYTIYLYANAFTYLRMGYASALAWILFALIFVFTVLVIRWYLPKQTVM
ncbi:MAG: carbohydrate ABC transporter permease [Anaerolineae bacterium]